MGIEILLLADFGEENANLIRDVADSIIGCGLAPLRELAGDGDTFFTGGLVALNEVVFRLDEFEEFLA